MLSLCGVPLSVWFRDFPRPRHRLRHINYDKYDVNNKGNNGSHNGGNNGNNNDNNGSNDGYGKNNNNKNNNNGDQNKEKEDININKQNIMYHKNSMRQQSMDQYTVQGKCFFFFFFLTF